MKKILVSLKQLIWFFVGIAGFLLGEFMPKQKNLIIFRGSGNNRYNESSKYLFEYMSKNKDFDVYWFTSDKKVRDHVLSLGCKVLYGFFDKMMILPKARMVIDTGSFYIDYFKTIGRKVVKICLMHGVGPKASLYMGESENMTMKELARIHRFDFVNFTSDYTATIVGKLAHKIPYRKILIHGYPRDDQYFDKDKCRLSQKNKQNARRIFPSMEEDVKLILYTPTWRKDMSKGLPIFLLNGFNLNAFNNFLKKDNLYVICTVHPNVASSMDVNQSNFFVVDYAKDVAFDINSLMLEADMLINDYSTTSTDFALLDRPQIFVMPDYEEYVKKDCFTEDYRAILPGKEVFSFEELKKEIRDQLANPGQFSAARQAYLKKYYDVSLNNSCELHANFIRKVLDI